MPTQPEITERAEQPYAGIRTVVTVATIPAAADRIGEIIGWLAQRGTGPAGPPFLKYDVIDMAGDLEIVAGVPTATVMDADGELTAGLLPAGRYATVSHIGPPSDLVGVTTQLIDWARQEGLHFDMSDAGAGERWACRLESYLTNPAEQPDMSQWETRLEFRLAE
jgi:effector-binding domain-containing protein